MDSDKRQGSAASRIESPGEAAASAFDLARRYVVQETVAPLRHIVRRVGLGTAGALAAAIGLVLLLLGVLRLLQSETGSVFAGNMSFAPFLLTAVVAVALAASLSYEALRLHAREKRPR